jgi:anaerobic selenocysteine-containing dehydrogenase
VRTLLLDRGTMLAGSDDLLATARAATVTVARRDAVALGIVDGDRVRITAAAGGVAGAELVLSAVVADDLLPGVVVLPRSSTDTSVTALADAHGRVHVLLSVDVTVGVGA